MKKAMAMCVVVLAVVLSFTVASLFAEEKPLAGARPADAVSVPNASAASPAVPTVAAGAPQPAADNPFSIEKLVIGLGLCAVIVLAVFRWGKSSHTNARSKDEAASGSPST